MQELGEKLDFHRALRGFLNEDIGTGDLTSLSIIPPRQKCNAVIISKLADRRLAVLSGIDEVCTIFEMCGCSCMTELQEGSLLHNRSRVFEISGEAQCILKAERTALNLLMRMSGIASITNDLVKEARRGYERVKILATRKTAPGLRYFDKKAVVAGGGFTHRMRLDDMVLIKDNHLELTGSVIKCISKARAAVGKSVRIECEARSKSEALAAVSSGVDVVMLDNFTTTECSETIKEITRRGFRGKCKIELSGGINLSNIRSYAKAKPDFISIGFITHSASAIDFSLEVT